MTPEFVDHLFHLARIFGLALIIVLVAIMAH